LSEDSRFNILPVWDLEGPKCTKEDCHRSLALRFLVVVPLQLVLPGLPLGTFPVISLSYYTALHIIVVLFLTLSHSLSLSGSTGDELRASLLASALLLEPFP
jgi:hypothetical protein